jgi:hypothetical protein
MRAFNKERSLENPLDVHSGINTGLAIAGDISGPLLREFALMGDPVDVADHLKDEAPAGRIQVGEETYRLTRDVFEFEPAAPVQLAGRDKEIGAFDLLSDRPQIHRRRAGTARDVFSALVGRDAELARLRELVGQAVNGQGSIVSLMGEAGLGKSRLLEELKASPEASGASWLEGRSLSVGQQMSYHPFVDLLRSWAGITDEDADAELPIKLAQAVEGVFGERAPSVYPLLASVMSLPLTAADQERIEAIQGDMLQSVLKATMTELLEASSSVRPLVLVFDDLHWADLSSIELLESLLEVTEKSRVLIVNVLRPGHASTSERIQQNAREEHAARHVEIELGPLGEDASRELINNLFRNADIPYEVRRQIVERSGGTPLYVEEVVRSLIEEGAVEPAGNSFRATAKIHDAVIPATVGEVIQARLDRLDPVPKQVLRVAAVIGGSFHVEPLKQIFEDKDALEEALATLLEGQFIVPWDRRQGDEFAFKHPLAHEVVYDGLIEATREQLHLEVGEAIEASLTENFPGLHAMLAYHYSLGKDIERAEESLFRAGDEAARSSASNEALHFFREASKLYVELHGDGGDPEKRSLLERNVGMSLYNRGHLAEACDSFDRALEFLGRRVLRNPYGLQARMVRDLVTVVARLYLPRVQRQRSATDRDRRAIDIMLRRSESQAFAVPERFGSDSLALIREVQRIDPASAPEVAQIYAAGAGIFSFGGVSLAAGQRCLESAREAIERTGQEPGLLYLVLKFVHHFLAGDWSDEHELDEDTVEKSLRDARLYEIGIYLPPVAHKHVVQGRYDRVRHWQELLDQLWDTYRHQGTRAGGLSVPMFLWNGRREPEQARQAAEVYFEESATDVWRLTGLSYRAIAEVLGGDLEVADATLARAGEIEAATAQLPPYYQAAYWAAQLRHGNAHVEAATGQPDEERAWKRTAARSSKKLLGATGRVAAWRPEALRLEGRRLWLAGREAPALKAWSEGLEAAERLEAGPDLARTCFEIARRLGEERGPRELLGQGEEHYAERARQHFETLGLEREWAALADDQSV